MRTLARVVKLVDTTDLKSLLSSIFTIRHVGAKQVTVRVFRTIVKVAPTFFLLLGVR
jgi:hypothetical protein